MQPEKIGRYEISAVLGRGAMGTVYKAFDPMLQRFAAIKVMNLDCEGDEELRSRFYREARSAAKLAHPNIISIFDLGEDEGRPFIAMQYLEGQDLKTIIQKRLFVPFERKIQAVAEICEGLNYAHRRGIVHRDIKPSNIFMTHQNEIQILDFGLARIDSSEITCSGQVMGSPYYMSPEQVLGKNDLDGRSDIFSLGVLFYEWLAYSRPFEGESPTSICYQIVSEPHLSLTQVSPHCAPQLTEIIDCCLAKDPGNRFQDCADLAAALRDIVPQLGDFSNQLSEHLESLAAELNQHRAEFDEPLIQHLADDALFDLPPLPQEEKNELGHQFDPSDYGSMLARSSQGHRHLDEIAERREKARQLMEGMTQARQMLDEGQLDDCQELLARLLKGNEENKQVLELKEELKEGYRQQQLQLRVETALAVANRALEDGDFQHCLKAAASALRIDPESPEALELQHQASQGQKAEKVRHCLEKAEKQEKKGDFEGCLETVSEALQMDPGNSRLIEFQQRVGEAIHKQQAVAQHLEAARGQLEHQQFDQALSSVQEALQLSPDDSQALELNEAISKADRQRRKAEKLLAQALAFEEKGDLEDCQEAATQALQLGLESSPLEQLLERVGLKLKQKQKVLSILEQARQQAGQGDYQAALPRIDEALALDPEFPEALELKQSTSKAWRRAKLEGLLAQGREHREAGEYQEWYQLTARALQLEPDLPEIKQMYEEASRHLQLQKEHQTRIEEMLRFARSEIQRADFRSALENLAFLLDLEPGNAQALSLKKQAELALETPSEQVPAIDESALPDDASSPEAAFDGSTTLPMAGVAPAPEQPPEFVPPEAPPAPPREAIAKPSMGEQVRKAFSGLSAKMAANRKAVLAGGGAVLLLLIIVVAVSLWPVEHPLPPPVLPGTLLLNVSPWAEVEAIIRVEGNQPVDLPSGDRSTPYLQQLPSGTYRVRVRNPLLKKPYEFEVIVADGPATRIHKELPGFDRQKAIAQTLGLQPEEAEPSQE